MMIHVTDILHALCCEKYAWNIYHKISLPKQYFHMIEPFSSLWKAYLGLEDAVCGQVGDTNEMTMAKMKDTSVILFARFSYDECRTQIPVLIKREEGYHAIYPYLSCYPRESEAFRMKLNDLIAQKAGISIVSHEIIYIQKDYVRKEDLDLHSLLVKGDCFFNRRNNPSKNIDSRVQAIDVDLDACIAKTKEIVAQSEINMERNKNCTAGRRCSYYASCFDDSVLPDDSVLFLTTSQNKLEAYRLGLRHISQMDIDQLEGYRLQYAQFMASRNGFFMDRLALSQWLDKVKYPISYLDFEWDTFGIPPYPNMKPFDVLCFQYSLHIETRQKELEHRDFFGTSDCRKAFIESLLNDLPSEGSILVYNMEGAEKLRLMQLAEQFPEYADRLKAVCDRMMDLSKPFETGIYYDNRMRGHYSLKNVLPVFTDEVSYKQLAIHDGLNAVHAYRTIEQASVADQKKIREDIRNYCRMDTYAEYVVYHGLINQIKEEENA